MCTLKYKMDADTRSNINSLKRSIIGILEHSANRTYAVDNFKTKYSTLVNSERRRETLNDVPSMLDVLEKRCLTPSMFLVLLKQIESDVTGHIGQFKEPHQKGSPAKDKVNDQVTNDIGHSYREFARCLGVPDAEVFCTDERYPTCVKSRIRMLLRYAEEEIHNGENDYIEGIQNALRQCGRNDIKKKIDKIVGIK